MNLPPKANSTTFYTLSDDGRTNYPLPAHGYIDRIELIPREDLPNFDASQQYQLKVDLIDPHGRKVPLQVQLIARDVSSL